MSPNWSLVQQNWSVTTQRILTMKIKQGTKFGTLKKSMFSFFDVIIFWFNGKIEQGHDCQRTISENNRLPQIITFPRIIAPFWGEKRNNRPWLLFEEIRYFCMILEWIARAAVLEGGIRPVAVDLTNLARSTALCFINKITLTRNQLSVHKFLVNVDSNAKRVKVAVKQPYFTSITLDGNSWSIVYFEVDLALILPPLSICAPF